MDHCQGMQCKFELHVASEGSESQNEIGAEICSSMYSNSNVFSSTLV